MSSEKRKKKVDDLIDLSNDEENEEMWEEAKALGLGVDMLEEHYITLKLYPASKGGCRSIKVIKCD